VRTRTERFFTRQQQTRKDNIKRIIAAFVLTAFFALPALAAAEVRRVYIAPKFFIGSQDSGQFSRSN
jgi:hypothetical protein